MTAEAKNKFIEQMLGNEKSPFNIKDIIAQKPVFVNERGIKFWHDHYANKQAKWLGLDLMRVQVYLTQDKDGMLEYLIVKDNEPWNASQNSEQIHVWLNILDLLRKDEEQQHVDAKIDPSGRDGQAQQEN